MTYLTALFASSLLVSIVVVSAQDCKETITNATEIENILNQWNDELQDVYNRQVTAEWNWATNINQDTEDIKAEAGKEQAAKMVEIWKQAICMDCSDEKTKRRLRKYQNIGTSALDEADYERVIVFKPKVGNYKLLIDKCNNSTNTQQLP